MDDDNIERGPKAAERDGEGAGSTREPVSEQPECVNAY